MAITLVVSRKVFPVVMLIAGIAICVLMSARFGSLLDSAVLTKPLVPKEVLLDNYLEGFYTRGSFFDTASDRYALLYNHRPRNEVLELSLRGKLLNTFSVAKGATEGIHLVQLHGDDFFSIIQARGIQKSLRDGTPVWYRRKGAHHELAFDSEGNVYTFDLRRRKRTIGGQSIQVFDDDLVKLSPEGKEISRFSLFPLIEPFITGELIEKSTSLWRRKGERYDLFHLNSMSFLGQDIAGVGKAGELLLSVRNLNLLVVLSYEDQKIVWSYQSDELQGQHHASVTPEGKLLVFDNGSKRERSRLLLIDPQTKEILWKFDPRDPKFFTKRHGTLELLPNGNFFTSLGRRGTIYEITPEKKVVAAFTLRLPNVDKVNPYRMSIIKISDSHDLSDFSGPS